MMNLMGTSPQLYIRIKRVNEVFRLRDDDGFLQFSQEPLG
jgi:hypothetical protein